MRGPQNGSGEQFLGVIAGKYRHLALKSPLDARTHPMGAREKNALFNSLGDITGLRVLDAFAGTGALGIEALSRGATEVVFVEKVPKVMRVLEENLEKVREGDNSARTEVVLTEVEKYRTDAKFDLILADPPYDLYEEKMVLKLPDLLKKGGKMVLSLPKTAKVPEFSDLELLSRRNYAAASLAVFEK